MTEGRSGFRLRVLGALVLAMFAALTARLWFLQVLAVEQSRRAAESNAVRLVETPARRGEIRDVSGEALVESRLSLVLTINRQEIEENKEDVLYRLSQLLGVPAAELGERLGAPGYYPFSPIPIAVDVPEKLALYVREHDDEIFRGVSVQELPVRSYPLGNAAAHVLGYLNEITQEELESPAFAGYGLGDLVGRDGVEAVYEHDLAGTPGIEKYLVNAVGEDLQLIGRQAPVPGDDVYLTLDADTQRLAEESLRLGMSHARTVYDEDSAKYLLANAGAVVVMNPDTGGIEAMASVPTFHPTLFTRQMSVDEFERRFGVARGYPLLNRAIAGLYPPGSTYKPMVALSALTQPREDQPNQTILNTQQGYGCPPSWTVPYDEDNPDAIQFVFDNWTSANLGFMSVARSLAVSCDTVYYPAGYEYWRIFFPTWGPDGEAGTDDDVFREPLQRDLRALGFDAQTNVDLPFEAEGRVPTAEWKREIHQENPDAFPFGRWVPGDFVNMSIGQGDTLVTPLQLAAAYSAIMNDGRACTPHVLDRVVDSQTGDVVHRYSPRCRLVRAFEAADVAYVRDALTGTVRSGGTAAGAFAGFPFTQVWVAGKTGTAQVEPRQDNSWFAAMVESQGERHVVVVLVEQGGHGSTTAAPIARHIVEGLYGLEYSNAGLGEGVELEGTDN